MDGLSRWDLVLWIVVAYVAVMSLVHLMLHHRSRKLQKLQDRIAAEQEHGATPNAADNRREAA